MSALFRPIRSFRRPPPGGGGCCGPRKRGADIPSSCAEYQLSRNNEYLLPKEEAIELESAVNRSGRVSDLPSDVGWAAVAGKVRLGPAPASGKQWKVPSY